MTGRKIWGFCSFDKKYNLLWVLFWSVCLFITTLWEIEKTIFIISTGTTVYLFLILSLIRAAVSTLYRPHNIYSASIFNQGKVCIFRAKLFYNRNIPHVERMGMYDALKRPLRKTLLCQDKKNAWTAAWDTYGYIQKTQTLQLSGMIQRNIYLFTLVSDLRLSDLLFFLCGLSKGSQNFFASS